MAHVIDKDPLASFDIRLAVVERQIKHLIQDCREKAETRALADTNDRINGLEISVRDIGSHFVKYQENLAGILVQQFEKSGEQIQYQKDKLQGSVHDLTDDAISKATEEIMSSINTELKRMQDSVPSSEHYICLPVSSQSKEEMSTRETASTTSNSEDSETHGELQRTHGELQRLLNEARKDIDVVYSDLRMHQLTTEKRLVTLEADMIDCKVESKGGSQVISSDEFGFSDGANLPRLFSQPSQPTFVFSDGASHPRLLSQPSQPTFCMRSTDAAAQHSTVASKSRSPCRQQSVIVDTTLQIADMINTAQRNAMVSPPRVADSGTVIEVSLARTGACTAPSNMPAPARLRPRSAPSMVVAPPSSRNLNVQGKPRHGSPVLTRSSTPPITTAAQTNFSVGQLKSLPKPLMTRPPGSPRTAWQTAPPKSTRKQGTFAQQALDSFSQTALAKARPDAAIL